jgi:hypothetical protein
MTRPSPRRSRSGPCPVRWSSRGHTHTLTLVAAVHVRGLRRVRCVALTHTPIRLWRSRRSHWRPFSACVHLHLSHSGGTHTHTHFRHWEAIFLTFLIRAGGNPFTHSSPYTDTEVCQVAVSARGGGICDAGIHLCLRSDPLLFQRVHSLALTRKGGMRADIFAAFVHRNGISSYSRYTESQNLSSPFTCDMKPLRERERAATPPRLFHPCVHLCTHTLHTPTPVHTCALRHSPLGRALPVRKRKRKLDTCRQSHC